MRCVESVISQPCDLPRQCRSAGGEVWPEKQNRTCAQRRSFQTDATFGSRPGQWRRGRCLGDSCRCLQRGDYFQHRPNDFRPQCGRGRSEVRPLPSIRWRSRLLQQDRCLTRWRLHTANASSPMMSLTFNSLATKCTSLTRFFSRARWCSRQARATLNLCEGRESAPNSCSAGRLKWCSSGAQSLPMLFGHCIIRGKTQLTVTTPTAGIWQIGGEIAEQLAHQENLDQGRRAAMHEVRRCLPGVDFSGVEIAIYPATRAEAKTAEQKRPSGVHISRVAPGIFVGWPTKLSMAPILAEEVFALVQAELKQPAGYEEPSIPWATPPVARYPWEEVKWFPAR